MIEHLAYAMPPGSVGLAAETVPVLVPIPRTVPNPADDMIVLLEIDHTRDSVKFIGVLAVNVVCSWLLFMKGSGSITVGLAVVEISRRVESVTTSIDSIFSAA